jgi:hypothetical protein
VRILAGLTLFTAFARAFQPAAAPTPKVHERSHRSQVMGDMRTYRIFLPPAYNSARTTRYPVIYWFHGYERIDPARDQILSGYVAAHPVIVVDSGPIETTGSFPLYFPELVQDVDRAFRTIADRGHRAVTGVDDAGFFAIWQASKCPDLIASASSFNATPEVPAGPNGFDAPTSLSDLYPTLDPVRIRQSAASASIPETLDFHRDAFENPLPSPGAFSHYDPYPNFGIWNWEVVSDRRQPGFTLLENVGRHGFRCTVREWIPAGAAIPAVKLSLTSPGLYKRFSSFSVAYIRLRDGLVRRKVQKADSRGRLTFELDGDAWEVGVGPGPAIALAAYEIGEVGWATAGKPARLRMRFYNKGAARSAPRALQWDSPTVGVKFAGVSHLKALAPGESTVVSLMFTAPVVAISGAHLVAEGEGTHIAIDVPVYPTAPSLTDYSIADGVSVPGYPHPFGEGNQDGRASPGESFAVLVPDGGVLRPAEIITGDACVDNSVRITESATRISIPTVRPTCAPGHRIAVLARVGLSYYALEIPVSAADQ